MTLVCGLGSTIFLLLRGSNGQTWRDGILPTKIDQHEKRVASGVNWLNSQNLFSHQDQVVNIFDKKYDFFILLRRPLGERSPVLLIFNAFKALNVNFSKIKFYIGEKNS